MIQLLNREHIRDQQILTIYVAGSGNKNNITTMRYQKVAAVFSPIIGALARVPADTEHDSLQEAERELTTENIIKDVALSGNNALNLANISDCGKNDLLL